MAVILVPTVYNPIITNCLKYTHIPNGVYSGVSSSIGYKTGKYYLEVTALGLSDTFAVGITDANYLNYSDAAYYIFGYLSFEYGYKKGGDVVNNYSQLTAGLPFNTNDIIGILLDMDNKKLSYTVNGIKSLTINISNISNAYIATREYYGGSFAQLYNFGLTKFAYPIPDGYKPFDPESNQTSISISYNSYIV